MVRISSIAVLASASICEHWVSVRGWVKFRMSMLHSLSLIPSIQGSHVFDACL